MWGRFPRSPSTTTRYLQGHGTCGVRGQAPWTFPEGPLPLDSWPPARAPALPPRPPSCDVGAGGLLTPYTDPGQVSPLPGLGFLCCKARGCGSKRGQHIPLGPRAESAGPPGPFAWFYTEAEAQRSKATCPQRPGTPGTGLAEGLRAQASAAPPPSPPGPPLTCPVSARSARARHTAACRPWG